MSVVRKTKVIAIACSDIHLSSKAPIWRTNEPDWFEAMKRPLQELHKLKIKYNCPIFCAGDIFDQWNSSAELINFALENLPNDIYAIAGQHDLPLHNLENIKQSAYWTLVKAGKIINIEKDFSIKLPQYKIKLYGFPFNVKFKKCHDKEEGYKHIAIIHNYYWIKGKSYKKALESDRIFNNKEIFTSYDIVIIGDNHKSFKVKYKSAMHKTTIFNCGGFMRRKSDEINHKPQVGLIYNNGEIEPYTLDTSLDKFLNIDIKDNKEEEKFDMTRFIKELENLDYKIFDFREAIEIYLKKNKINKYIKQIILESMEKK